MNRVEKFLMLVFVVAVWAGIQHAHAQIKSGIRLGLNYGDLTDLQPKNNNGFHAGAYLKISLAGIMALEPGLQYSQRKFHAHPGFHSRQVRLNYLDVPVILRFGFLPFANIFGGPQASVLLGQKYTGDGRFDAIRSLPKQELGGVAGIGVKLPLGINVQGSYDFGFTHLEHNGHQVKNKVFKISLGKDF